MICGRKTKWGGMIAADRRTRPASGAAKAGSEDVAESRSFIGGLFCGDAKIVSMQLNDLIVRDPTISGGEPVIRGTRVTLRAILASLADGDSVEQIVGSFPSLNAEQIRALISDKKLRERTR